MAQHRKRRATWRDRLGSTPDADGNVIIGEPTDPVFPDIADIPETDPLPETPHRAAKRRALMNAYDYQPEAHQDGGA